MCEEEKRPSEGSVLPVFQASAEDGIDVGLQYPFSTYCAPRT